MRWSGANATLTPPPTGWSRVSRPSRTGRGVSPAVLLAVLGLLGLAACGTDDTRPSAATSSAQRTPEYSVSSTFSLPAAPVLPGGPSSSRPSATAVPSEQTLAGDTVLLDPGHNGGNAAHPEVINRKVDAGGFQKECDTAGTSTNAGYPEYDFTLDVAQRTAAVLRSRGAKVVLTRTDSKGIGPCVDARAAAGNRITANAALSIHADGGPATGVGFHVIEPGLLPGRNEQVVQPSQFLGRAIHQSMLSTGEPISNYVGSDGYSVRTDLGGLNLSTVPKVFVECGNMRNATDAGRLTDPAFRAKLATALANGLSSFLFGR
jgi:N-acetylmuramoyl-L-alanine amidase